MNLMGLGSWPELWLPLAALIATIVVCTRGLVTLRHLDSSRAADPEAVWPAAVSAGSSGGRDRHLVLLFGLLLSILVALAVALALVLKMHALLPFASIGLLMLLVTSGALIAKTRQFHRRGVVSRAQFGSLIPQFVNALFVSVVVTGIPGNPVPSMTSALASLMGGIACGAITVAFWRTRPPPRYRSIALLLLAGLLAAVGADALARSEFRGTHSIGNALDRWLDDRKFGAAASPWEILADAVEQLHSEGRPVPLLDRAEETVSILRKGPRGVEGGAVDAIVRIGLATVTDFDPRGEVLRATPFWNDRDRVLDLPYQIAEARERLVLGGIAEEDREIIVSLCLAYLADPKKERLTDNWTVVRMLDLVRPDTDLLSVRAAIEAKLDAAWVKETRSRKRVGFSTSSYVDSHETWAAVALIERTGARPALDLIELRKVLAREPLPMFGLRDTDFDGRLERRLSLARLDRAGIVIPGWPWPAITGWLQVAAVLCACTLFVRVICGAPAIPLPRQPRRLPSRPAPLPPEARPARPA